eukprot:scaffold98_cov307-Prasinococcus_capsulatus_cf.AAC.9
MAARRGARALSALLCSACSLACGRAFARLLPQGGHGASAGAGSASARHRGDQPGQPNGEHAHPREPGGPRALRAAGGPRHHGRRGLPGERVQDWRQVALLQAGLSASAMVAALRAAALGGLAWPRIRPPAAEMRAAGRFALGNRSTSRL